MAKTNSKGTSGSGSSLILFRHVNTKSRGSIFNYEMLCAPFESITSTSSDSNSEATSTMNEVEFDHALQFLVAIRFPKQSWVTAISPHATAIELFQANQGLRRIESVLFGQNSTQGWYFRLSSNGDVTIDYEELRKSEPFSVATDVPKSVLSATDGKKTVASLRKLVGVEPTLRYLDLADGKIVACSESGRKVAQVCCGYYSYFGKAAPKKNDVSEKLVAAIKKSDSNGIREAVAAGASLGYLPGHSKSPMAVALLQCHTPQGRKCFEQMVQLGGSVEGLLFESVLSPVSEDRSIEMLKVLLKHKLELNKLDPIRGLLIVDVVNNDKKKLLQFLVANGANPKLKDPNGDSAMNRVQCRLDESTKKELPLLESMMSILLQKKFKAPVEPPLKDQLEAENRRFAYCLKRPGVQERLKDKTVTLVNGQPARFERLGIYLDLSSWKKAGKQYSSAHRTKDELKDLDTKSSDRDIFRWTFGTRSAIYMIMMRHLEYAGAKLPDDFMARALRVAKGFVTRIKPNNFVQEPSGIFELGLALLIGQFAKDSKFLERCASKMSGDYMLRYLCHSDWQITLDCARWLLVFSNAYRAEQSKDTKLFIDLIRKSRDDRAKYLLDAYESVTKGKSDQYCKSLSNSLEIVAKEAPLRQSLGMMGQIPFCESLLANYAASEGMELAAAPRLMDWLLVCD